VRLVEQCPPPGFLSLITSFTRDQTKIVEKEARATSSEQGRSYRTSQLTRKFKLLLRVPLGVFTLTGPVVAPLGTLAVISVLETTLNVAAVLLKVTLVAPVRLFPKIVTAAPTTPEIGSVSSMRQPTSTAKDSMGRMRWNSRPKEG
jgi:hypothetical protein